MSTEDPLREMRKIKIAELRAKGVEPYRLRERPAHLANALHSEFGHFTKEELEAKRQVNSAPRFSVAGRIMLLRSFGKAAFLTLRDRSGRIQAYAQSVKLSQEAYEVVKQSDLGDIVFVEGTLFKTKTGELTIDCEKFELLTKNARPLPEKFHGLQDIETRYRKRYLDLICNEESKKALLIRSNVVQKIREFFLARDYMEVETPMLHPLVSGAAARPFKTFHNTLKMNLFLRIAPELYLKRLVVGGFDRVFEMNRCFRNEGISTKHNPEFTMLEFYEAYATYEDLMNLTEELIEQLATEILGSTELEYEGHKISLKKPFKRLSVRDALKEYAPELVDRDSIVSHLKKNGQAPKDRESLAELEWKAFEEFVEGKLIQPTYITEHPIEVSPLARRSQQNPSVAERFELYIAGREIANGFNELNDPEDQRSRFLYQQEKKAAGDEEAVDYDADYIEALEYGLPPTAGEGVGIDRLAMLLSNSSSIRDVILFPQMRALGVDGEA